LSPILQAEFFDFVEGSTFLRTLVSAGATGQPSGLLMDASSPGKHLAKEIAQTLYRPILDAELSIFAQVSDRDNQLDPDPAFSGPIFRADNDPIHAQHHAFFAIQPPGRDTFEPE